MKTFKLAFLSSTLILTFATGFTQARLGSTFAELDKEFPDSIYRRDFGKNQNWGYFLMVDFDNGRAVYILNDDSICINTLFIPINDESYSELKKQYDSDFVKLNEKTWVIKAFDNGVVAIITELYDPSDPIVVCRKRYFKSKYIQ